MGVKLLDRDRTPYERILVYGAPKSGKTRLCTSLPEHFGEVLYWAADPNAEGLDPVLPQYMNRLHILKPEGKDPIKEAFEGACRQWEKDFPKAKTIVWDTLTHTAKTWLQYVADKGMFSTEKHIQIGTPGTPGSFAIPMMGDYMSVQNMLFNWVEEIFKRPMHVIVLCHEQVAQPDGGGSYGGPATVGKAAIQDLAGKFNCVFRVERKSVAGIAGQPSKSKIYLRTDHHGYWTASVREGKDGGNQLAKIEVPRDPVTVWQSYLDNFPRSIPTPE